jgi:hypothetical protein
MSSRTPIGIGLGWLYGFRGGEARNPILGLSRKAGCLQGLNRSSTVRKNWNVTSRRNGQLYGSLSARPFVELLQPLSQPMSFNTCDGVFPGVEGGLGAGKYLGGDVVLGKLTILAPEMFLNDVVQEIGQPGRSAKRFRDRFEFLTFRLNGSFLGVYLHDPGPRRSDSLSQHWMIQSRARVCNGLTNHTRLA